MAKREVLILQHADWERAGRIGESLEDAGLMTQTKTVVDLKKPQLPPVENLAGLVLLGGPMRADDYENFPGLKAETKLAKAAVEAGIPVLGGVPRAPDSGTGPGSRPTARKETCTRAVSGQVGGLRRRGCLLGQS